jgi:hypothetical protein
MLESHDQGLFDFGNGNDLIEFHLAILNKFEGSHHAFSERRGPYFLYLTSQCFSCPMPLDPMHIRNGSHGGALAFRKFKGVSHFLSDHCDTQEKKINEKWTSHNAFLIFKDIK